MDVMSLLMHRLIGGGKSGSGGGAGSDGSGSGSGSSNPEYPLHGFYLSVIGSDVSVEEGPSYDEVANAFNDLDFVPLVLACVSGPVYGDTCGYAALQRLYAGDLYASVVVYNTWISDQPLVFRLKMVNGEWVSAPEEPI